ncbi:hypothetical protein D3C75_1155220 [compost metagenome]
MSASQVRALSSRASVRRRSAISFSRRASWMRTMPPICSRPRRWNRMISSMRLRNSGRKWARTCSMTRGRTASTSSPSGWSARYWLPRLEVMMIRVFLKSMVRP